MTLKSCYGYSDLFEVSCEIDCVIDRQRKVLQEAEEKGPYILVPHSLSGLEAISSQFCEMMLTYYASKTFFSCFIISTLHTA
jgi:hypothetical protein